MNNQTWQIQRMKANTSDTLLIRGGRVIDPANDFDGTADVLIVDGKIAAVKPDINFSADYEYAAAGKIVTPGLIDMHVHLREPGQEAKEGGSGGRLYHSGDHAQYFARRRQRRPRPLND